MIREAAQILCDRLMSLAPQGVERNSAKDYFGFGVKVGGDFRLAVHVGRRGTAFFTQDLGVLATLAANGVPSEKILPDSGRDKDRYRFPKLSLGEVDSHLDQFRELVETSVRMKEQGF